MTATSLAPYPVQKFFDNNGVPLAGGLLTTYAAGTNTPIATYVDSIGITTNTNPIHLNFRGECALWLLPNVGYKFALTDSLGNAIPGWPVDNIVNAALISLYGGVDTGVANAYILTFASPVPPNTNGQVIFWLPANSNTGPSTINVNGGGPQPILNPNGTALGANQILANQFVSIIEINGIWQLYGGSGVGVNVGTFGQEFVIAGAATTDMGSASGHNVSVTGSGVAITSFGTSAQIVAPIYIGRFTGANTLTNSSSLILPGGLNITTQNGDSFIAEFMGSGTWRVLHYQPIQPDLGFSKVKSADTAITSSTTLTADPALLSNPLTIGQYEVEIYLLFDSVTAAAGFKWELNGSAVDSRATLPVIGTGFVNGSFVSANATPYGSAVSYATVSNTANSNQVLYKGCMLVSTAGTLGIQWAQNTSNGSATTLRAGSYITATPIGNSANSSAVTHLYTTPGSAVETIPAGVTTCVIEVFGGAGSGGGKFQSGCSVSGGGGGGSGGYSRTSISVGGSGGLTMNYTVGAGGTAGLSGGPSSVSSGSFSIATMTGGGGTLGGAAPNLATGGSGGAGGTASGGTAANTAGNTGSAGVNNAGGGAGGTGAPGVSGINAGGNPGGVGGSFAPRGAGGNGVVCFSYS